MLVNGQPGEHLSLLDRGLHYGDGLFETIAVLHSSIPLWERHYARLTTGCSMLDIPVPGEKLLKQEILQLGDQTGRQVVKLIITRGEGGRGYFPAKTSAPTRILLERPWPEGGKDNQGIDLHLCESRLASGSALAGVKHLNRLEQVMAAREVAASGCHEGVVCDQQGHVVEGIMANLFWMDKGQLVTPPVDQCGVAGVMRAEVIAQAGRLGIDVMERRIKPEALQGVDALFMTNAVNGIVPVRSLGGWKFNVDAIPQSLLEVINEQLLQYE